MKKLEFVSLVMVFLGLLTQPAQAFLPGPIGGPIERVVPIAPFNVGLTRALYFYVSSTLNTNCSSLYGGQGLQDFTIESGDVTTGGNGITAFTVTTSAYCLGNPATANRAGVQANDSSPVAGSGVITQINSSIQSIGYAQCQTMAQLWGANYGYFTAGSVQRAGDPAALDSINVSGVCHLIFYNFF